MSKIQQFSDLSLHTYSPEASVEHQHGWVAPSGWEFVSEVQEYERKPENEITYDHDSEVDLLDRDALNH